MPLIENFNDVAASAEYILISMTMGVIFGIAGTIAFYAFFKDKKLS